MKHRFPKTSKRLLPVSILLAAGIAVLAFTGRKADAVSGCCSRHRGVCECACCDGTPLSETCRSRMPECGGKKKPTPQKTNRKSTHQKNRIKLPETFVGTVAEVKDGDTIRVLWQQHPITIRVADIDCPEFKQPFGIEAMQFTGKLLGNQSVTVNIRATDRYGRTVADVRLADGTSLAAALLKAGLAWWYHRYSSDKSLEAMEKEARLAKRGLWAAPDPIPPWVYRREERQRTRN
jgi:micrococcal nuclease